MKKVYEGEIIRVFEYEVTLFNEKKKIFECVERLDSVQIIASIDNKILINIEMQPDFDGEYYALPGGMVERGEDRLESANRELFEETGYKGDLTEWYIKEYEGKVRFKTGYYVASNLSKQGKVHLDAGEKLKTVLVSYDEFIDIVLNKQFRNRDFRSKIIECLYFKEDLKKLFNIK